MKERLIDKLKEYLVISQGRMVSLKDIREYLKIEPGSPEDKNLRVQMSVNLVKEKIVVPSGKSDGYYKVIRKVKPVQVFGRERRPPIELNFPRDYEKGIQLFFAGDLVIREGDAILIAGQSNFGKTMMALNFCAENIDAHPVLMGNEYTTVDGEPSSRFLNRLDNMDWVQWCNGNGDNFTLLPVRDDYAEHVVKDRINIIDWINLDEAYNISKIMEGIKRELGKGIAIITIQKAAGSAAGRGGQYTKDFADVELLLDSFGENEVLLTLGKVKESRCRLTGKTYAFGIMNGVKIVDFREVKKCTCQNGFRFGKPCDTCGGKGYVDTGL